MPRAVQIDPRSLPDDTPMKLQVLARAAFPDGSVTAAGLRREAEAGRLVTYRIAGVTMSTMAAIRRMVETCRVQGPLPDSGFGPLPATVPPSGASSTAEIERARAVLQDRLRRPKPASRTTSPPNATRRERQHRGLAAGVEVTHESGGGAGVRLRKGEA